MSSRCYRAIVGILALLLITSFTVVGCGSAGEASTTTEASLEMSLADYKAAVAAILADLQTAGEAAAASLTEAAGQTGDDSATALAQAEQISQATGLWSDMVAGARSTLEALPPPDEAGSFHADFATFLEDYGASIDELGSISGYTAGVITAYSPLEAAVAEGGVFSEMNILTEQAPEDLEGRLALGQDGAAVLRDFQTQWQALTPPDEFVEIHGTVSTDLGTAMQTADLMLAGLSDLVESDSQGGRDALNALSEQFDGQWLVVEQDLGTWQTVRDQAESQWAADQDEFAAQLNGMVEVLNAL